MKAAILQIGDIHIQGPGDLACQWIPRAAQAFNEISFPAVELVIVALCGDLSYSGKADQYAALHSSLMQLKAELIANSSCAVHFVAIPGNHDCDLTQNDAIRELLIASIPKDNTKLSDKSIVNHCVRVQGPFWEYLKNDLFDVPTKDEDKIYLEHIFSVGGEQIKLRLYNTAWVSTNPEIPGRMGLPRMYFQGHDLEQRNCITVAMLHHPTHWLTPNRKREFDVVLDHANDLVLFGHEHLPEEYIKSDFDGNRVGHIYGGVFQEKPTELTGNFNIIIVDTQKGAHQIRKYKRSGKHLQLEGEPTPWTVYGAQSPELVNGFRLSKRHLGFLEDAEVEFAHPSGKRLMMDDIFITPDFSVLADDQVSTAAKEPKLLRGDYFDNFVRTQKKLIILGNERSGRTSLGKKIFWLLYRSGIVPVIIHGSTITANSVKNPDAILKQAIFDAYENPELPAFDQFNKNVRAVIIDGFERAKIGGRARVAFLEQMERKFGYIVALGDPLMMLEEIASGVIAEKTLSSFAQLMIREMGRTARRRLIRRWYSIGLEPYQNRPQDRLVETERIIDTLLGKSFLPANPIFVLSFLQSIESARPMDNIGSYGYHYEAFITNALSVHATQIPLDVKYQFLSEFAFALFSLATATKEMEESQVRVFHQKYCDKYGIDPDRSTLLSALCESRLLEIFDGSYRFKYAYAYYFFTARYLRDHIDQDAIRAQIRVLCTSFHVEQNANIWMFLAHLSKSEFLLDTLVEQASALFKENLPLRLEDDVQFIRELGGDKLQVTLPEGECESNLEQHYDELDEMDKKVAKSPESDDDESRTVLARLDAMLRTIQVLGQVLKNFPGSLTAVQKFKVVQEAFTLGLRGLSYFMGQVDEGKNEIIDYFAERVARRYQLDSKNAELIKRVKSGVFYLLHMSIFGMIKLISQGVGAKGEETTYKRVVEEIGSKSAKLIDISIALDTLTVPKKRILDLYSDFRGDYFNAFLLSSLVARHLYLFPVQSALRAELCQKLNISVETFVKAEAVSGEHVRRA